MSSTLHPAVSNSPDIDRLSTLVSAFLWDQKRILELLHWHQGRECPEEDTMLAHMSLMWIGMTKFEQQFLESTKNPYYLDILRFRFEWQNAGPELGK